MRSLIPTFDGRRAIPSPEVTKIILEMLNLQPGDKVLEIGTGSGAQTAELAKTGAEVHSIELEPWVDPTSLTDSIFLHAGDGAEGIPGEAPFRAIVATCGVKEIPRSWQEQIGENGSLVAPIGDHLCQRLTLYRKFGNELVPQRIGAYVRFQMLRAKPKPREVKPVYASH